MEPVTLVVAGVLAILGGLHFRNQSLTVMGWGLLFGAGAMLYTNGVPIKVAEMLNATNATVMVYGDAYPQVSTWVGTALSALSLAGLISTVVQILEKTGEKYE